MSGHSKWSKVKRFKGALDVKRGALYVGVGNSYSGPPSPTTDAVIAFDLKSGARKWVRQVLARPRGPAAR